MPPQETFIVEDSDTPMPDWLKEQPYRGLFITWIQNRSRMGQVFSIDRAYQQVKTDYIAHLEDDWEFIQSNYMRQSKDILDAHPDIWMVSLRGDTGWHPLIRDPRYPFPIAEPYWRGGWGGFSWNFGLRRLSDYKRIGSSYGCHVAYGQHGLGHELQLSRMHLDMGYRIADIGKPHVVHIGGGRSRAIEPLSAMPRILIAIPACHKYEYGQWESEQSPHFNPANKPYGTDIHISGHNDRIQTLRDTWLKDIEPFKAHVDYRFFYGEPHTRPALTDEVYLTCPDDYGHLPDKTIAICKWAVEQGYSYVFKCDDDTAVFIDRLVRELMTSHFDYGGYVHHNVCTGGPGYWLSKRAMEIVARSRPTSWAEDVTVSHALNAANINPVMLPGHRTGGASHWYFGDSFDATRLSNDIVTCHAVQPHVMREWWEANTI